MKFSFFLPLALAGSLFIVSCSTSPDVVTFRDIADSIYSRYYNTWFSSVTFSQYAIEYENELPADTQIWHETYLFPGRLIIKYDSINSGSGMLFRNDSMYDIINDTIIHADYIPHDLIILTMDMYKMKPDEFIPRISGLGYDTSAICTRNVNGNKVYIIGTRDTSDLKTRQFWIDAEDFRCFKVISPRDYGLREVEMSDFFTSEGKWIEQKVIFKTDGKTDMREEYFDIRFNTVNDSLIFYPDRFSEHKW